MRTCSSGTTRAGGNDLSLEQSLPGTSNGDGDGGNAVAATEAHHNHDSRADPHRSLKAQFARDVVRQLDRRLQERCFNQLFLIAPPVFLGLLRAELPSRLRAVLAGSIDKDLTKGSQAHVVGRLAELLPEVSAH
jgi:protein required for attachment to host cells